MSRLRTQAGGTVVGINSGKALKPILPKIKSRKIPLRSPSGVYRLSAEALKLIDQSEARTARVFTAAAAFAFR